MMKTTTDPTEPAVAVTEDRLLPIGELAERLGVSVSTVQRCVRDGMIPVVRIRHAIRFDWAAVRAAVSDPV